MENEEVKTPSSAKATEGKAKKTKLEVQVLDLKGKAMGTEQLSEEIFGQKDNKELVAQYVRVYTQNQRQGTVATKTRSEVIGTTKKIYKQKGTGGARHGSRKANLFKGGGVTFGPQPREFALSMNKKMKRKVLFISLSQKAKVNAIKVLGSDVDMKPKTKVIVDFLKGAKMDDKKVTFVLPEMKKNGLVLSARNIPNVQFAQTTTINPYMIMNSKELVFVGDALKKLEEHFLNQNENQ